MALMSLACPYKWPQWVDAHPLCTVACELLLLLFLLGLAGFGYIMFWNEGQLGSFQFGGSRRLCTMAYCGVTMGYCGIAAGFYSESTTYCGVILL